MGQGRIWKRGRVWWIQYNASGRQYRESANTSRRADAEALLRERLQSIWDGRFFPHRGKRKRDLTIAGLLDLWVNERSGKRSLRHDETRLGAAVKHFGKDRLVATITADDVAGWRDELAEGHETATVNRHLAVLRSALRLAAARGHAHQDPLSGIRLERERNARNRICSPDEYAAIREAAVDDTRAVVTVGYWIGMRLGEIAGLTRERLDLRAGTIRLAAADTKEGQIKTLALPRAVVDELKTLPVRTDGRVFAYDSDAYSKRFAALCRECEIADLRFHDLRHTAATNMRRAGLDLMTIAAFTGHKTLAMLKRYQHVSVDDLRDAMSRVEAHAAGRDASKR